MIEEKNEAAPANDAEPADLAETGVGTADERLAALEAELADVKDRLLRALAETENTRRRAQREREDTQKYAVTGFARDLLSPVDNLHRALASLPESEVSDPNYVGTALTMQTALGFLLTGFSIRAIAWIGTSYGWRWAAASMAIGPVFGIASMLRLTRASKESSIV